MTRSGAGGSGDWRAVVDAQRAFRLQMTLAALALCVGAATVLIAVSRLSLAPAVVASCSRFVPSVPDVIAAIVLTVTLVGFVAAIGTVVSLSRQLLATSRVLRRLAVMSSAAAGVENAIVFDEPRAMAFCAGWVRPRVYVSSGAVETLSRDELRAVLAHEHHHVDRRDPLRVLVMRALADAFFFLPALRRLAERYADLAEVAADEAAVRKVQDRRPLAAALVVFDAQAAPIAPERVDRLLGLADRWRPSAPLMLRALGTIAAVATAGVALVAGTTQASVALPAMFGHLCVLVLTGLFAGVALLPLRR